MGPAVNSCVKSAASRFQRPFELDLDLPVFGQPFSTTTPKLERTVCGVVCLHHMLGATGAAPASHASTGAGRALTLPRSATGVIAATLRKISPIPEL